MIKWSPTQYNFEDGEFAGHVVYINYRWQWSIFDRSRRDHDGALPCGRGHEPTVEEAFDSAEVAVEKAKAARRG